MNGTDTAGTTALGNSDFFEGFYRAAVLVNTSNVRICLQLWVLMNSVVFLTF